MVQINRMFMYNFWGVEVETASAKRSYSIFFLDGSALAIVFLRAKHAGATVLHMQFSTHHIFFTIDLWRMNHWEKSILFLVENLWSNLNLLNQRHLPRPGSIREKNKQVKISRLDLKSQIYSLRSYFMWNQHISKIFSGSWVTRKNIWKTYKVPALRETL